MTTAEAIVKAAEIVATTVTILGMIWMLTRD